MVVRVVGGHALGCFPGSRRARGWRADLKWQVPEKCFPTNHTGSRNEESKHNQWVPGSGWPPPPTEPVRWALLPCSLGMRSLGARPTGKSFCFGCIHKGVPQELQTSLSWARGHRGAELSGLCPGTSPAIVSKSASFTPATRWS